MAELIEEPNDFDTEGEDVDEIINYLIKTQIAKIDYGLPAIINSFDSGKGVISCKPIGSVKISGTEKEIEFPTINNIPIMVPFGSHASLFIQPEVGQKVWLSFSSRSIDEAKNGANQTSGTVSKRRFSLQDCVAFMGLRDLSKPILNENNDDFSLGFTNSDSPQIPFPNAFSGKDNKLRIGSSENDVVEILYSLIGVLKAGADTGGFIFNPATQALLTNLETKLGFIKY